MRLSPWTAHCFDEPQSDMGPREQPAHIRNIDVAEFGLADTEKANPANGHHSSGRCSLPTAISDVAQHASAGAKGVGFDAHLVQHPHKEVGKEDVVLAVVGQVTLVFEAAASEEDR